MDLQQRPQMTGGCGTEWAKMIGGRSCDWYTPTSISCRLTVAAALMSRACERGAARGLEEWTLQATESTPVEHGALCVGVLWCVSAMTQNSPLNNLQKQRELRHHLCERGGDSSTSSRVLV